MMPASGGTGGDLRCRSSLRLSTAPGTRAVITTTLTFNVYDNITQAAGVGTQAANCEAPERTSPASRREHVSFGQPDSW